jgi:hypothetical protein
MAASKWLGTVKNAAPEQATWTMFASTRRTRREVVSGCGEIGRQATVFGRGAAHRHVWAVGSVVAVEHATIGHGGDLRVCSRMDTGVAAIREES